MTVLYGLSFGFEDTTLPANNARTTRAPLTETVQFSGGEIDYSSI
jgi:hypothetical protein